MKKLLISICLLWAVAATVWGQQDARAVQVLDRLATQMRKAGGVTLRFGGTQDGVLELQGNRFHLKAGDVETWFDGQTQWSYVAANEEVSVSSPTPEETQAMNPYALLDNYKQVFDCKYVGSKTRNGVQGTEVILTPKQDSEVADITLTTAADGSKLLYIAFRMKSGDRQEIVIREFRKGQQWDDAHFRFDPKQYPDAEIIDLR